MSLHLADMDSCPHLCTMDINALQKLLTAGQDNLMLRFGLGSAYLKLGDYDQAIEHLEAALRHDVMHSASWKLLGKAMTAAGATEQAMATYEQGIAQAETKGDIQAAREMRVFLKRLSKPV